MRLNKGIIGLGLLTLAITLHAQLLSTVSEAAPDSIVQVTAEAEGLTPVDPATLPLFAGCWWTVYPGGGPVPMPCPPQDLSVPIYEIASGIYLVDSTGGAVSVSSQQTVTSASVAAAVERQGNAIADLIEQVQETELEQTMAMSFGMEVPMPGEGGGDGGGTNSYGASFSMPDYGTNLWIAQVTTTNGYLTAIASNTLAEVLYEVQTNADLATTNWHALGAFPFFYGSSLTNWTALDAIQINRAATNVFFRLRSWADDGSGLPIWWQLENFGVTAGVDPYGNPAGDGWSNLQKFQNGWNPNTFYTPAAPQGMAVTLHQTSSAATLNWLPAPGNVTGYTVEKSDGYFAPPHTQTFTVSSGITSFTDDISTNSQATYYNFNGHSYGVSYRVQASYDGGNSSWSASVPLQAMTVSGIIAPKSNGTYLAVSQLPATATTVQLVYVDWGANLFNHDSSFDHIYNIPVSSITNGLYQLPADWQPPHYDTNGPAEYDIYVRALDAAGNASKSAMVAYGYVWGDIKYWALPFYDGRAQMKQNLVFQLRIANTKAPFGFYSYTYTNGDEFLYNHITFVSHPADYAYAGFHDVNNFNGIYGVLGNYYGALNIYLPFEDNLLYRNFVFNAADVDPTGNMTTGVNVAAYLDDGTNVALHIPPAYQPTTNTTVSLLAAPDTRWLCTYAMSFNDAAYDPDSDTLISPNGFIGTDTEPIVWTMYNTRNYWGLPFVSAKVFYSPDGSQRLSTILQPGNSLTTDYPGSVYLEAAPPQFQTVEYDFWKLYYFEVNTNLPGTIGFSPTNKSDLMMVGVGQDTRIAAYAKLAVTNGYPGVYGYLGQYLDKAYKVDGSGNVTTNLTGMVSPYGNFVALDAGVAALVTMPDIDTGERGTCAVYCVSLQLDKNHDGNMDLRFSGADATSPSSPFVFWRNNNFDRWLYDSDDETSYEDDAPRSSSANVGGNAFGGPIPDYDYMRYQPNPIGGRAIPTKRDLEDFTRLWVCGVTSNLLAALPAGSRITLSWDDVGSPNPDNPTLDLFTTVEANGGTGYLTNSIIASNQVQAANGAYNGAYVGRLGPGQSIQLNSGSNWISSHFIWCGVSNGMGGLTLTIADANSNVLAQTTAYIQIKDIKQMYERWTVGEKANEDPQTSAVKAANDLVVNDMTVPFEYDRPQDTNTPYILFVHGWNMTTEDKDRFAETAFKRLYWQGYQGRFGSFRWPTESGFKGTWDQLVANPSERNNYDRSEFQAWKSGTGLKNMLTRLNILYTNNVYLMAHSMGNVVAGEALKQAGSNQVVNTYVAMQAAVPAHAYDPGTPWRSIPYLADDGTLERYTMYWTNGADCYFHDSAGAGTYVNFYNTNDFALDKWQINQNLKPDSEYSVSPGELYFYSPLVGSSRQLFFPADTFEIFSRITEARCYAFGAQADVGGVFKVGQTYRQVELPNVWPPDASGYTAHFWHSAEFRADNAQSLLFWDAFLTTCKLK